MWTQNRKPAIIDKLRCKLIQINAEDKMKREAEGTFAANNSPLKCNAQKDQPQPEMIL